MTASLDPVGKDPSCPADSINKNRSAGILVNENVIKHPRAVALDDLARSGLKEKDFKKLKLEVLASEQTQTLTDKYKARSIRFPYLDAKGRDTGFYRLKFLDEVRRFGAQKPIKYWQPPDTLPRAYLPPGLDWEGIFADASKPLWITEGEKKAAAGCKAGLSCLGLGGVWSWRSTKGRQPLIPDLALIKWQGRVVYLCFDTDADPKPGVTGALETLGHVLEQRGATVNLVRLPLLGDADKTGLDDYLVAESVKALLALGTETLSAGAELLRLNDELAVIDEPSCVLRLSTGQMFTDPSRMAQLHYGHVRVPTIDAAGRMVESNAVMEWLRWPHHRRFRGVAYEPGQPRALDDGRVNLWAGWPRESKKGDVSLFKELLARQTAMAPKAHRDWLLQWMAYPIQHPGAKLYTAVVFWSRETGTGKSLVAYTLGRIYGPAFSVITESQLHSGFNDWQVQRQLILGEEITGSDRANEANRLKHLITGETVSINKKYQAPYEVRNCANFFFTTNHYDAFMLDAHDRRYFVHEVGSDRPSLAWFAKYDAWYRTEEAAAALMYYLQKVDLTGFNPRAPAPQTQSRNDMVEASGSEADLLVRQLLAAPEVYLKIGDAPVTRDLYTLAELVHMLDPDRRSRLTQSQLMRALRRAGCPNLPLTKIARGNLRLWAVRSLDHWARADHAERVEHYTAATTIIQKPPNF